MKQRIVKSVWDSRKPSTLQKHCLSVRKFFNYCKVRSVKVILPLTSLTVAQYLEHVKSSSSSLSAVSDALISLKWLHYFVPGINDSNNPLNDNVLSRIVESSKRTNVNVKKRKRPLTSEIVIKIVKNLPVNPTVLELRDALIPILAFALLLRHDEISHLSCAHFTVIDGGLKVFIPSSKTDTYRQGKYVFLSKENSVAYNLFFQYISSSGLSIGQNHFLFCPLASKKSDARGFSLINEKLGYDSFNKIVKNAVSQLGFDPNEFGTHSARSGGASTLAPLISQYELMLSGRWSDPRSIGSYVETPDSTRLKINEKLDLNM